MKTFMIILCCIFFCRNGFGQHFNDYKARNNPIPIQESPYGEILIKVPKNRIITQITYDKTLDCFRGQYKGIYGCINTIWLYDLYKPMKDSIEQRKVFIEDSIRKASLQKQLDLIENRKKQREQQEKEQANQSKVQASQERELVNQVTEQAKYDSITNANIQKLLAEQEIRLEAKRKADEKANIAN